MEYLIQFGKDFSKNKIPINDYYNYQAQIQIYGNHDEEKVPDVITDLNDQGKPVSSACIPFAKQISTSDKEIICTIPQIGDLFMGVQHQPIIEKVNFIINNHTESIELEGILQNNLIWTFTRLPIPLVSVSDYDNVNLQVRIQLNSKYSLQSSSQDVFKAYYGYFTPNIQYRVTQQTKYTIPLVQGENNIKLVCGIWTIT